MSAIVGPIAPFSNLPIEAQFYQPSRFEIADIDLGLTTVVTTTEDHNYVVGQQVRLIIPVLYGAQQLSYQFAYVISIPSSTEVELDLNSLSANEFIENPLTATITGATKATNCVLTAANSFYTGNSVSISGVSGMTELNGNTYQVIRATFTTLTLNVDSTFFNTYTSGGTATLVTKQTSVPQIMAIGDIGNGQTNSNGRASNGTYIPGSFINISPE